MQHTVLLGRDSWMRFNTRSHGGLPPRLHNNRVLGELTLSHHAMAGVAAYAVDPAATNGGFHLLYDGTAGVALSDEPQLLEVNLVRSNGLHVLTGHYFVDIMPQPNIHSGQQHFVASRAGALLDRCRRPRARRLRWSRRRPTFARPASCLATHHPRCGVPLWSGFGQSGVGGHAFA